MRIVFLAPVADMSGGAKVITIYARELAKRGHDVRVIVAKGQRPTLRERLSAFRRRKRIAKPKNGPSHYDGISDLVTRLDKLGRITARHCPDADVVIATWWETAEWMMRLPAAKGVKVHFVQGYENFNSQVVHRFNEVMQLDLVKITISGWLADLLVGRFGNRHVHLVENGVDMAHFDVRPRSRSTPPTIGMLYNTAPFKNANDATTAVGLLRKRFPDARLITFGAEPESDAVPLPNGTTHYHLPAQDVIPSIYAACDVWLCSSSEEGFYLPGLEAMACRCPVISTPVGILADIVRDGENGYLVPHNDAAAMSARLVDLFEAEPERWREMSDMAHATALSRDWTRSVDRFEQILLDATAS